jgi:hypothetical protein
MFGLGRQLENPEFFERVTFFKGGGEGRMGGMR